MDASGGVSLYPSHRTKTIHLVFNEKFSLWHSSFDVNLSSMVIIISIFDGIESSICICQAFEPY